MDQSAPAPRPVPVMDVVMPKSEPLANRAAVPSAEADKDFSAVTLPVPTDQAAPQPAEVVATASLMTPPKSQAAPGVVLAIVATVFIVLGIAALITFAYLRTQ